MAAQNNYLDVSGKGIVSLAGLENFEGIGLTGLDCALNQLSSLPNLPSSLTRLWCRENYLNVFEGSIKTMINACPASNKEITPQYKYSYSGAAITLNPSGTHSLTGSELQRKQSSNGSEWTDPTDGNVTDFTFSSSDDSVATVDGDGLITAIGNGSCDIYAKYKNIDSEYTKLSIPVTVVE